MQGQSEASITMIAVYKISKVSFCLFTVDRHVCSGKVCLREQEFCPLIAHVQRLLSQGDTLLVIRLDNTVVEIV